MMKMPEWLKNLEERINFSQSRNKAKFRIKFYRKLRLYCDRGLSLQKSVELLKQNTKNKRGLDCVIYNAIIRRTEKGLNLGQVFRDIFPDDEVALLEAYARKGALPDGFVQATNMCQAKLNVFASANQLAYPGFLIVLMIGIMFFMSIEVFPDLAAFNDDMEDNKIVQLSDALVKHWPILLTISTSFIVFIIVYMLKGRGAIRDLFNSIPPFSFYRGIKQSTMLLVMAGFLRANIPVKDALYLLANQSKGWCKYHYKNMYANLHHLGTLDKALDTGFFDNDTLTELKAFSDFNEMDEIMDSLSQECSIKVAHQANVLAMAVRIAIMIGMFAMIVSLFMIIYQV